MSVATRLKQKLEVLRELDPNYKIFGSGSHKYKLNPCISIEELESFEAAHHVRLPEDYRYFLLNVGNGGAGPGYGLLPLSKVKTCALDKPFPFTEGVFPEDSDDEEGERKEIEIYGSINFLTFGCSFYAYLVTTGKEQGNIWFLDYEANVFAPIAYSPDHSDRYNLLAWYEQWLDVHINALRNGEKIKRAWAYGFFTKGPVVLNSKP